MRFRSAFIACTCAVAAALLAACSLLSDTEPVITEYRHLMRRVVLWQGDVSTSGSGNILDLGARTVTTTPGPSQSEERAQLASGSSLAIRRAHRVEIPILTREEAEFAQIMARRQGCPVQLVMFGDGSTGAEAWAWYEPSNMNISQPSTDAGSLGTQVITLDSRVFDAAIWQGDFLSGVPWVGTTPSNGTADASASLQGVAFSGSDYLVSDQGSSTVRIYDTSGAQQNAFAVSTPNVYGVTRGNIDDSGTEVVDQIIYAAGDTNLYYIDPSTGTENTVQATVGPNVFSLEYISADNELIYGDDTGIITIAPADGTAGSTIDVSGTSTDVFGVAWDGTDLWFSDSVNLYQLTGKTNTVQNTFSLSDPVRGIVFEGSGDILGVDGGNDILQDEITIDGTFAALLTDVIKLFELIPDNAPGYQGPVWTVPDDYQVSVSGEATGSSSTILPAEIEIVLPIPGVELQLSEVDGSLDGTLTSQDWDGADLDTSTGTDPTLELSGTTTSENVWTIEISVDDPLNRPTLTPIQVGEAFGARPGALIDDCDTRATTPDWQVLD